MSDPFIVQIYLVGYSFAQRSFALAEGQLLPISNNTALFSLYGTIYGGDGRTTFALPDLRGRCALGMGDGPGLTNRPIGQKSGTETNTQTVSQMASHSHTVNATNADGDKPGPGGKLLAAAPPGGAGSETIYHDNPPPANLRTMSSEMIANTGGSQPQNNMQPYLVVNFAIALRGLFPSRN